jgi:hypothetical protein
LTFSWTEQRGRRVWRRGTVLTGLNYSLLSWASSMQNLRTGRCGDT